MNSRIQPSLWDDQRLTLEESIQLSIDSLNAYGDNHRHWAIAYSGGKDSTATVSFVVWAIRAGKVKAPESLTILYADTRQELEPLQLTAIAMLEALRNDGFTARAVLPDIDNRFYVYMFGRGVPPPSNRFRWCTGKIKIDPMNAELENISRWINTFAPDFGLSEMRPTEKFLMLTGVRFGESAARDERIALSCSKDDGECGQGWYQVGTDADIADTLAPLLHWRLCHVWDWLYGLTPSGVENPYVKLTSEVAVTYGDGEVRFGCAGCNLASRDTALEQLIKTPQWNRLAPLLKIKPMFTELKKAKNRLRKPTAEIRKDGKYSKNAQRLGPLTFEARLWGLETIKTIQKDAGVDLINAEEEARIRELVAAKTWPEGWSGEEPTGDVPLDSIRTTLAGELTVQPLLVK